MAVKTTATSLIMAALATIGDYSVAAPAFKPATAQIERPALQCKRDQLRAMLSQLCAGFAELDEIFSQAIKVTLKRDRFEAEFFEQLPQQIAQLRGLETALRGLEVSDDIATEHMAFRRAIAKLRGRMVQLESLWQQTHESPQYVVSSINMDGLRALADHTTQRLATLA